MASTLPNPSANHNEIQSRLLGDSLRHHEETNIWSKNTDINTFRGNVETKDGFEKLNKGIDTGNKLLVQQNEGIDVETNSFLRAISSITGVFERLGKSLRDESFSKMFDKLRVEVGNTAAFMKTGGERFHTGMKELTNGIGFIGPAMNNLKSAIFKGIAIFNILAGTLTMFGGILNLLSFGILGKLVGIFRDFGSSLKESVGKKFTGAKEKITGSMELDAFKRSAAQKDIDSAEKDIADFNDKDNQKERAFGNQVADNTVNISGQSIQDIGNSVANKGESNDRFEMREYEAKMDLEEALADKKKKQQELFNKKREKDESKFQAGRIVKEGLFFLFRMAPYLALAAGVAWTVNTMKETGETFATGIATAVQLVKTKITDIFKGLRASLSKMFPKLVPPAPTTPKGTKLNKAGKLIDEKTGKFVKNTVANSADDVAKSGAKEIAKKAGSQVLKKIPIAGAVYETVSDANTNAEKLDLITAAYENKTPVIDDGNGGLRPLTKEEFEGAIKANKANAAGSVGRGAGALGGAAAGAAIGSIIPGVGTLVGGVVGGLVGGIFGGRAGDKVATDIAGDMLGVDDPQGMIDALTSNIETNLSGDALANLKSDIDSSKMAGGGDTVVNNVANTNNVNNQESLQVNMESVNDNQFSYSTG